MICPKCYIMASWQGTCEDFSLYVCGKCGTEIFDYGAGKMDFFTKNEREGACVCQYKRYCKLHRQEFMGRNDKYECYFYEIFEKTKRGLSHEAKVNKGKY